MSQHDFDIANQGFPATRADLNNALKAAVSNSAGTSAPSTTYAYQFWYDSTNNIIKMRNGDNDAWISVATVDQTNDLVSITHTGMLDLVDDDGSASIRFQAPSTVTSTTTFTLPDGDGDSGQTLITNGSSTLSWHAPYGNRNVVVNGSFAVSQRGTSFSAPNGAYTLDRMRCAQANSADTISQQTFTAGQTDVPGSPRNYLRFAFGAATANRVLETRIEDVYTGSGQSITLSFYAKASAAHTSTIEMTQSFGSGGSSAVAFGTQSYDITTSWQRFSFTLSCPSISGKTVGAGSYLSAAFIRSLSAGPSINVDIALLQLEISSVATPFEHERFSETLQKAMRYYEKGYDYHIAPGTSASYPDNIPLTVRGQDEETSGQRYFTHNLKVEKRASPTNTFYDEAGNSGKVTTYDSGGTPTNNVSIALVVIMRSRIGAGPGNSAIWGHAFYYESDAEL